MALAHANMALGGRAVVAVTIEHEGGIDELPYARGSALWARQQRRTHGAEPRIDCFLINKAELIQLLADDEPDLALALWCSSEDHAALLGSAARQF